MIKVEKESPKRSKTSTKVTGTIKDYVKLEVNKLTMNLLYEEISNKDEASEK